MTAIAFARLVARRHSAGPLPPAAPRFLEGLALAQAVYYGATGLWSLLAIRSFQRVTGPKADLWLVKTVGALVLAIGAALGLAGARGRVTAEVATLAAGSAAALGAVDVVYVARRRIRPIYMADAAAEAALALSWLAGWLAGAHGRRQSPAAGRVDRERREA